MCMIERSLNQYLNKCAYESYHDERLQSMIDEDLMNAIHHYGSLGAAKQAALSGNHELSTHEVWAVLDNRRDYERYYFNEFLQDDE